MFDSDCSCPLQPGMSFDELMDEIILAGKNCCDDRNDPGKGWICPTLDKEMQRARAERRAMTTAKKAKIKKLKAKGLSSKEIVKELRTSRKYRKNTATVVKSPRVDLDSF